MTVRIICLRGEIFEKVRGKVLKVGGCFFNGINGSRNVVVRITFSQETVHS